jgi:hypothetical protein
MRRLSPPRFNWLALVAALAAPACSLTHQGRMNALSDAVHDMVDETRWGRADLAADRVAPAFRARFVRAHAGWGERIEIADLDVGAMRMARDEESATAVLTVQWYALDTMDLATTRVRQRWTRNGNHFVLAGETILAGDPRLLDLAEPSPAVESAPDAPADAVPAAAPDEAAEATTDVADEPAPQAESTSPSAPAESADIAHAASAREG